MRRFVLALATMACALTSATAGAATVNVSPGQSLTAACTSAQAGDTIVMAGGNYGSQGVTCNKAVTYKAATGQIPRFSSLAFSASNVTFDGGGAVVDHGMATGNAMYINNTHNLTIKNLSVGRNRETLLVMIDGGYQGTVTDLTFDNVEFHDSYIAHSSSAHVECIFDGGVQNLTIRNSWFHDCTTFDLFVTDVPAALPKGLVLENTVFESAYSDGDPSIGETPTCCHSVSTLKYYSGSPDWPVTGLVARNNTFDGEIGWPNSTPSGSNRFVGNIVTGSVSCKSGITFAYNVLANNTCGSPVKRATVSFTNGYHLPAGSPAIGAASPTDSTATDRDGNQRDNAPDAGAYEYQASAPPPPPSDRDGDGVPDSQDACPDQAGTQPDGCPPPTPPPSGVCDQACVDAYKAQIADLTRQLADMTASRDSVQAIADAYKARAEKAEATLAHIHDETAP